MDDDAAKLKMFAARLPESHIERIGLISRAKGVTKADVVALMVDAYQVTPAEAAAIRSLIKADKESLK